MAKADSYLTIRSGATPSAEFVDRKSRFIAQLVHVSGEADAQAFLAEVRSRHHDARHNVPAWVLADGRERCSDDGEPQRTAGMPTLEVLRGAGLADVCCVVTRYFGGTLLGPGGLVRAYSESTKLAVEAAREAGDIVEMTLVTKVVALLPYSAYDRVVRLVSDTGGKVVDSVFSADVQLTIAFKTGDEAAFVDTMVEMFAGDELCLVGEPSFAEF